MTTATKSTVIYTLHRFEVPTDAKWGAAISDFGVALNWANQKADELGIDKSFDDLCRIFAEDDAVVIIVTEQVDA